jgi:hypothetical protein
VKGKSLVLLNSKASPVEQSYALAEALRSLDLSAVEMDPEVRSFLMTRGWRPPSLGDRGPPRSGPRLGPGLASTAHRRHRRPESR